MITSWKDWQFRFVKAARKNMSADQPDKFRQPASDICGARQYGQQVLGN
jgi:hypothetical protein